ncbi:DUF6044 family protein [Heyndrickxia acidicola]|uniref:DUF6044 family protein n=1 Tax=Heyndrickxia acidicola TaxID=209389 RepID=A0ABU6MHD3_9BACI|nr:DUF6044 family protein [Heyndrickxia acidicola]MED1203808.1 DUF6044 family protein [Heyndrickxia acidicola]
MAGFKQSNRLHSGLGTKEKIYIGVSLLIIIIWVSPYFFLGQNAHMRVQDNLDSNIAWYKVLNESGQLFGSLNAHIPQIINGEMRRDAFYSQFYGVVVLFSIFPPIIAYGLTQLITRLGAFLGMYLLLKHHFMKEKDYALIQAGTALTFALTPFWPSGMLSILGMPLALWAFLNIRNGSRSWKNFAVLTILPFLSSFILGFCFFLSVLGIFWAVDAWRAKKWNGVFLLSILYMTCIYLLIDYRLVVSMIVPSGLTNRNEFVESDNGLMDSLSLTIRNYVLSHNQDRTESAVVIMPLTLIALGIVLVKKEWRKEKLFIGLHILNFVLSLWYAFWFFEGWQPLKDHIAILTTFNFGRFHYLRPGIIYVLFAISLRILWRMGKWGHIAVTVLLAAQLWMIIPTNEQINYSDDPSYKQYFAQQQFTDIKNYIGLPQSQYRVVSIGIHPDIAQYNGFYTLDTYNNFYPLSYKHQFRKIIAPELNKSPELKSYFDQWGGRCYIFVSELGEHYMYSKYSNVKIKHLQLNTAVLKQMGGRYVLSAVPILNAKQNHLAFEKSFNSKDSWWEIYLYKVQ